MTKPIKRKKNWIDFILIPFVLLLVGSFFLIWFWYLFKGIWDMTFHYEMTEPGERSVTIGLALVTLGLLVVVLVDRIFRIKKKIYWRELTELYQLEPVIKKEQYKIHLLGLINGRKFRFYERTERSGKYTITFTGFELKFKSINNHTLHILDNRWNNIVPPSFNKKHKVITDDPFFNKRYKVYAINPLFANQILTSTLRQELNMIHTRFKGVLKITPEAIVYESKKGLTSTKRLELFHTMIQIANNLMEELDGNVLKS